MDSIELMPDQLHDFEETMRHTCIIPNSMKLIFSFFVPSTKTTVGFDNVEWRMISKCLQWRFIQWFYISMWMTERPITAENDWSKLSIPLYSEQDEGNLTSGHYR